MTRDGLVYGMPEDEYHGGPELSHSAMKHVIDCPARYDKMRGHKTAPRDPLDFGTVVHAMLLDTGPGYDRLDYPDRRTKAYKEAEKDSRAAGRVPLVAEAYDAAIAAAQAVRDHPLAGPMFTRPGDSEVSMFWTHPETGVRLRGRIDRVTTLADGTHVLLDFKTTGRTAHPRALARAVADFRYYIQQPVYQDGYRQITGEDSEFVFTFVEARWPHLVTVATLSVEDVELGRREAEHAIATYAGCAAVDHWPGYTDDEPTEIRLPAYLRR